MSNLYQNIGTISKNIKNDSQKIWVNKIYRRKFLEKYGHLRPLTYSITSKNYKENVNRYFPKNQNQTKIIYKKFNLKIFNIRIFLKYLKKI